MTTMHQNTAFCQESCSLRTRFAVLFSLLLVTACSPCDGVCNVQCRMASQSEYVRLIQYVSSARTIPQHVWIACECVNNSTATRTPDFPQLISYMQAHMDSHAVAVVGYPMGRLSANTLEGINPQSTTLALIKCEITAIEENALANTFNLWTMLLDFNNLTHVKQHSFSGVKNLRVLSLASNKIARMNAGCFMDLGLLEILNLQNNHLQTVDPGWFTGLRHLKHLNLELNNIVVIPPGAFEHLLNYIDGLYLGEKLSFLDGESFWGLRNVKMIHVVDTRLTMFDNTVVREEAWSLSLHNHGGVQDSRHIRRQDVSFKVSNYLLCITHDPPNNEQAMGWALALSNSDPRQVTTECGLRDIQMEKLEMSSRFLVLIKTGKENTPHDDIAHCRQGWEHSGGMVVALQGGLRLSMALLFEGNSTMRALVVTLDSTKHNTSKNSSAAESKCPNNVSPQSDINITCYILTEINSSRLEVNVLQQQIQYNETCRNDSNWPASHRTPVLKNQTKAMLMSQHQTTVVPSTSTQQGFIRPGQDNNTQPLIPIHIAAVVLLVLLSCLVLTLIAALLKRSGLSNKKAVRVRKALRAPGRARSSSLPVISHTHSDWSHRKLVSCRSLPIFLNTIEPNYCEISDDDVTASHTYWEILDDGQTDLTRSASLPALSRSTAGGEHNLAPCRSLPAVLPTIEPTYCNIPDSDDNIPLPYYGIAVDLTLPPVGVGGESRTIYHSSRTGSSHLQKSTTIKRTNMYERSKSYRLTLYGNVENSTRDHIGSFGRSFHKLKPTSRRHTTLYGTSGSQGVAFNGNVENSAQNYGSLGRISRNFNPVSSRHATLYGKTESHRVTVYGKASSK